MDYDKGEAMVLNVPKGLLIVVIVVCVLVAGGCVGVTAGQVEQSFVDYVEYEYKQLSSSEKTELFGGYINFDDNQELICDVCMTYDIEGRMGIALYHTPQSYGTDISFSVRFNFIGISFGYIYVEPENASLCVNTLKNGIACFMVENYGHQGFASMNTEQVCEMHIVRGNNTEIIEIDSTEPFVQVVKYEMSIDEIIFYDVNGEVVEYTVYFCETY